MKILVYFPKIKMAKNTLNLIYTNIKLTIYNSCFSRLRDLLNTQLKLQHTFLFNASSHL